MQVKQQQFRATDIFAFTFCSTITLGIAFLPYISDGAVRGAWLKLFLGSLPYFLLFWFIHRFTLKYSDYDFFGALKNHLWSGLYWIVMLYYILSTLLSLSKVVNDFNMLMSTYLLQQSPKWLVISSFLLVVGIGVYYGIISITRFVVLFVSLEAFVVLAVFCLGLSKVFSWVFIPPIWTIDLLTFAKSSLSDMARYGGVVVLLGYIMYVKQSEPIWKPMNLALGLVMILYVALSIVVVGTFGFEQSISLISPTTALAQTITTQAGIVERLDLFFLAFWIIAFFKITMIHLWFAIFLSKKCWPQIDSSVFVILFSGIIFLINVLNPLSPTQGWGIHNINVLIYSLLLPFTLIIYLLLRKNKRKGAKQFG